MYPPIEPGGGLLIAWQLHGKRAVLVGGGDVAAGRFVHLKNADAHVTLIAPRDELCDELRFRLDAGVVDEYRDELITDPEQIGDCDMVLTAIDDAEMSRRICAWSRERRIPVNVADVPPECDFYFGSVIRRGPLQVMVSTGGNGPRIARIVRQRLEKALPPSVGLAIDKVGALRKALRQAAPDASLAGKRMRWMTRVCDEWSLDDLSRLDDAAITRLIEDGWKNDRVPTPWKWSAVIYGTVGTILGAAAVYLAHTRTH
ncbi:Bifunctional dehydrogenase and ferrochelatase [Malassezia cuniculi]|uniref:precorrin-2 dehydrogenase n=1 Tax=Malassezia cuniculi TaxID=948313 RepID=A0AAF0EVT8_9BASI|nr:Bifunctional dehydrogenase and ferrochelatase [Malassezia cuniculi]